MAVLEQKSVKSSKGFNKELHEGSTEVIVDILQRGVYSDPESSVIRESVSNCFDAINERKRAVSIINGDSMPEDHFDMTKVDGIYEGSAWDQDYFNLKHLSDDDNVYITHEYGSLGDILSIRDNGVGLGGDRLIGYFKFGWSSKRAQKGALGKWGLGSKASFSLGIDSYRVINIYNGYKMEFEILKNSVNPITPRFSTNGEVNEKVVIIPASKQKVIDEKSGEEILVDVPEVISYREKTKKPNGLELRIPTIKSDRHKFIDAVKRQLGYIPGVVFRTVENGIYNSIKVLEDIIVKTDDFIITSSSYYSKPHILLGASGGYINYGFINFEKMNTDVKNGAIGIILNINDIDVTASRESPEWSKRTLNAVTDKFDRVTHYAETVVDQKVSAIDDYGEWLVTVGGIIRKMSTLKDATASNVSSADRALMELAFIVDPNEIRNITYKNTGYKFCSDFVDDNLTIKIVSKKDRVDIKGFEASSLFKYPIYYSEKPPNARIKDKYIIDMIEGGSNFLLIYPKKSEEDPEDDTKNTDKSDLFLKSDILKGYGDVEVSDSYKISQATTAISDDMTAEQQDALIMSKMSEAQYEQWKKLNEIVSATLVTDQGSAMTITKANLISLANPICTKKYDDEDKDDEYVKSKIIYCTSEDREILNNIIRSIGLSHFTPYFQTAYNSKLSKGNSYVYDYSVGASNAKAVSKRNNKLFGELVVYSCISVSTETQELIKNERNFISIRDFLVKKYNKKQGHIEFSDIFKRIATRSIVDFSYPLFTKKFSTAPGVTEIRDDDTYFSVKNLRDVKSSGIEKIIPEYEDITKGFIEAEIDNKFLVYCIRLALMDTKFKCIPENYTEDKYRDELLDYIGTYVPKCMCHYDAINSVDIIDKDLLYETMHLGNILKAIPIITLESFYYSHSNFKDKSWFQSEVVDVTKERIQPFIDTASKQLEMDSID